MQDAQYPKSTMADVARDLVETRDALLREAARLHLFVHGLPESDATTSNPFLSAADKVWWEVTRG